MTTGRPATRPAVMHDVARLAGVSQQTVSRVLNGHAHVRPATRDRVLEAIRQLNYRPNLLARGLITRRSRTIAVISFDTRLFGPASTLLAIEHAARAVGYAVTISSLADLDASSVRSAVGAVAGQQVDGAIVIAPSVSAAHELSTLQPGLPVVAVEAGYRGAIPVVSVDQVSGARQATEHLLSLGHRTVWHVAGPADWLEAQERIEGWRASLTEAHVPAPPILRGDWSAESGYRAGLGLLDAGGVTAVFAANDQMALGVTHAFYERGVRVPEDISVVGYDDIPESGFFSPSLTTVHQDFDEVGRRGLELLIEIMEGGAAESAEPDRIPTSLIVRGSSGPPRNSSRPL
jgi:DNA-binding LacI/PurR family transcriptional regulator